MPPKSSSGKEKDLGVEEEILQAVILADSFNKRFRPLTQTTPRCLLPICNAPLLDWTLESLALAGVQEVFVVVRSHAELVKRAIRESRWSEPSSGLKIVTLVTARGTFSAGDAMRDVYTHGVITGDFVLVFGDLVSNVRIDEVVRVHRERRKVDKDAIVTVVVKEGGAKHRTRARGDSGVFVLDADTDECLHYEPVIDTLPKQPVHIPRALLKEHPELEVRADLIDCGIDVCSVDVPSLFQDNFDYQDLRRDFLHGVLTSDLLMKKVHCYVLREGYAARVRDTRSYDAVSKDILARWTFPLVPDNNHPGGHVYDHLRGNRYIPKDNTVVLARTSKVGNSSLIGSSTQVYDNARVNASVIGRKCVIGAGAVITNAYIFDGTSIGAGTTIETSIVGANVQIGEKAVIPRGCLIGDGVVLGPGAKLRPFERVVRKVIEKNPEEDEEDEDTDDEEFEVVADAEQDVILGKDSNARLLLRGAPSDEDPDDIESFSNQRLMRIGDTLSDVELSDAGSVTTDEEDESASDDDLNFGRALSRTSSTTSVEPIPKVSLGALASGGQDEEFKTEVRLSLERAFNEGHSIDNAAVELKTLRMASNVPIARVREAVIEGIVDRIPIVEGDTAQQRKEIAAMINRWGSLITQIGGVDEVETIVTLQKHCASSEKTGLFGQVLAALYQKDIVDEDHIREWHANPASQGAGLKAGSLLDNMKKCWSVGRMLIQQFDEQESDESDEDEESE